MIRRSFRIGLWLGLLGGLGYALLRLMQGSKPAAPISAAGPAPVPAAPPQPWPRLDVAEERPAAPSIVEAPVVDAPVVAAPKPAPVAAKKAAPKKAAPKKVIEPWVDPKGDICPKSHPVKAKLSSKIFQVAGNFAYDRTNPDRCYRDAGAAEKDGFRAAKR